MQEPTWLAWAKELAAIAQNGLAYGNNSFDIARYQMVREIAAEILATYAEVDTNHVLDLFAQEVADATPKVDVRAAVFRDNTILLVKERTDGFWSLPGGWADVGESPGEAVVREVLEESGYHTRPRKLLALYDRSKHGHPPFPYHVYKIYFHCELLDDAPVRGPEHVHEIAEVAFFPEHELPELSLRRITPAIIARLFEHYRHPEWPADFD